MATTDPINTALISPEVPLFQGSGRGKRMARRSLDLLNVYDWLLPRTLETTRRGQEGFGEIIRDESAKAREFELDQFSEYAPLFSQEIFEADPRQAEALGTFNEAALDYLGRTQDYATRQAEQLDEPFDPSVYRDITQASLGQSALRGFGPHVRDAAMAFVHSGLMGNELQRQREAEYMASLGQLGAGLSGVGQAVGLNQAVTGNPMLRLFGMGGQPIAGPIQTPNYPGFTNDILSEKLNLEIMRKNRSEASKQRQADMYAGLMDMTGQIIGGYTGGL